MRDIELRGSNKKVSKVTKQLGPKAYRKCFTELLVDKGAQQFRNRKVEEKDLLRYTAGHVVRQLLGIRVSDSPSKGFHLILHFVHLFQLFSHDI